MKPKVGTPRGWHRHMVFSPCIGIVCKIKRRFQFHVLLMVWSSGVRRCVGWLHMSEDAAVVQNGAPHR